MDASTRPAGASITDLFLPRLNCRSNRLKAHLIIIIIIIIKRQLISRRNMPGDITRGALHKLIQGRGITSENERPGYETENKKHLSSLLKVLMDSALRILSGRLFQAV